MISGCISSTEALAMTSAGIAATSLLINYLSYSRDRGRLDVSIGVYEIWGGDPLRKFYDAIAIKIANVGRRQITIASVGGHAKYQLLNRRLSKYFPKSFPVTGFLLSGAQIAPLVFDPGGKFKVIHEGQVASIEFRLPENIDLGRTIAEGASTFAVTDSTGREHHVPSRVIRKFKVDFRGYLLTHPNEGHPPQI